MSKNIDYKEMAKTYHWASLYDYNKSMENICDGHFQLFPVNEDDYQEYLAFVKKSEENKE